MRTPLVCLGHIITTRYNTEFSGPHYYNAAQHSCIISCPNPLFRAVTTSVLHDTTTSSSIFVLTHLTFPFHQIIAKERTAHYNCTDILKVSQSTRQAIYWSYRDAVSRCWLHNAVQQFITAISVKPHASIFMKILIKIHTCLGIPGSNLSYITYYDHFKLTLLPSIGRHSHHTGVHPEKEVLFCNDQN